VDAIIGNGEKIMFWTDRWLDGNTMAEVAPNLFRTVSKRTAKRRTVAQALQNRRWVRDINGALTVQVWVEYLQVWDLVEGTVLQHAVPDQFKWKLTPARLIQQQVRLFCLLHRNNQVQSLEKNLEELGPPALQILHLVGGS
jgi:hypothetical protein